MRSFYQTFPIRNAVRTELSWTHYRILTRIENNKARQWYMQESIEQSWSARALERQIGTLYYERLLASQADNKAIKPVLDEAKQNTDALVVSAKNYLRDPYIFDFLGLPTVAKYSVLNESEQLFASKYITELPTEEELRLQLEKDRRLILEQQGKYEY